MAGHSGTIVTIVTTDWCQETLAAHTQTTHTEHSSSRQTFQNLLITGESGDPVLILPSLLAWRRLAMEFQKFSKGPLGYLSL